MQKLHFSNWQRDYPVQLFQALAALRGAAGDRPKPLVHIQYCPYSTGPGAAFVALAARGLGMRVVTTIHEDKSSGLASKSSLYQRAYPPFEAVVFKLSDAFVVHSAYHFARLPERVRSRARIIEFGMSPCTEKLPRARSSQPTVGCFGIIAPYKGIEMVVEACALAAREIPSLRLVIAGAVPASARQRAYFGFLKGLASARLPDRVDLQPNLSPQAFDRLYHESEIVCFGFQRVNQSTTFHKALEHGKPVVAADVGGVGELVRRQNLGSLVPVGDAHEMARALVRLFRDEKARRRIQRAVRRYVGGRPWSRNSEEHLELYRQVLRIEVGLEGGPDARAA